MPYPVLRISLPKCQVVSHGKLDYFNNLGSLVLKRLDKAVLRDFATRFFYKGEVIDPVSDIGATQLSESYTELVAFTYTECTCRTTISTTNINLMGYCRERVTLVMECSLFAAL